MFKVRVTQPAPEAEKVPSKTLSLALTSTQSLLFVKLSFVVFFINTLMPLKENASEYKYSKLMEVMVPPSGMLISSAL